MSLEDDPKDRYPVMQNPGVPPVVGSELPPAKKVAIVYPRQKLEGEFDEAVGLPKPQEEQHASESGWR